MYCVFLPTILGGRKKQNKKTTKFGAKLMLFILSLLSLVVASEPQTAFIVFLCVCASLLNSDLKTIIKLYFI